MLETFRRTIHLPYTKKIPCPFYHGTGKDPFGQLYPVSTCQDCHGRIEINILTPYKTWTYCPGTGLAFSTQNPCTSCKGRGIISLGNKELDGIPCQICTANGMGAEKNLPWIPCSGLGRR